VDWGTRQAPRRPARCTPELLSRVLELAVSDPADLDLPFTSWTLERLRDYANEVLEIPVSSARIGRLLRDEGLRWEKVENGFGWSAPSTLGRTGRVDE
jgi:transposase